MRKQKYTNTCSCQDIEFTITYKCEDEFEEYFCPFCGTAIEEPPEMLSDDELDEFME